MTQTPRTPTPLPEDNLVASYHAAVAELDMSDNVHAEGPSPQVRANVQAYAKQLAQARTESSNASQSIAYHASNTAASSTLDAEKPAANDGRWKIRALASIAIFGLSGLLFMQWDSAPQDEKDVAFSILRPMPGAVSRSDKAEAAAPAAAAPAPTPVPVIAAAPASSAATDQANQAPLAAPAQTRSKENDTQTQTQATAGAPSSAKKIKRETARSDSEASATPPSVADSAKDKAESIARPATPVALPAPASPADFAAAPKPDAAMVQSGAVSPVPSTMAKAAPPAAPAAPVRPAAATAPVAEANTAPRAAAAAPSALPAATRARSSAYDEAYPAAAPAPQGGLQRPAAPPSPNNALFTAIRNKDAAALQQALNEGADKNAKRGGTPAITLCVQAGLAEMVQLLVNAATDVNAVDVQGITPLAHARERGLAQIVSILLKAGAKYDANQPAAQ
jgi:hypothetical protein